MKLFSLIIIFLVSFSIFAQNIEKINYNKLHIIEINSPIFNGVTNILNKVLRNVSNEDEIIILKINSPGGMITETTNIINLIKKSPIPIISWIGPMSSEALSASAIIASSTHLLFMSKDSLIGFHKSIDEKRNFFGNEKKINLENLLKNSPYLIDLFNHSLIINGTSAFELKISQGEVNSIEELKMKLAGKTILLNGKNIEINLNSSINEINYQFEPADLFLTSLGNPSLVYILLILGLMFIFIEIQAPGGYVFGFLGSIFLIISALGMQILPISWASLLLIFASIIFFILETHITSFGILSILGFLSFFFGSMNIFESENGLIELKRNIIYSGVLSIFIFIVIMAGFIKYYKNKKFIPVKLISPVGKIGMIVKSYSGTNENLYHVKVSGEIWTARLAKEYQNDILLENDLVDILTQDDNHLILNIKKRGI